MINYTIIYVRGGDPDMDYKFEDEPASTLAIARTTGCGCCSSDEPMTRADLERYIKDLEEEIAKVKEILQ